jgi:hypothetical protein
MSASLEDPVLSALGVAHGFGRRGSSVPDETIFPRQVHGVAVLDAGAGGAPPGHVAADAVVSEKAGVSVGVVTADCVPILLASEGGGTVGAIHAGWRGLAAGVIEIGLAAMRARAGGEEIYCAVGPSARGCCYEVDPPVRDGLLERHAGLLAEVLVPHAACHFQLDLALLACRVLEREGLAGGQIGTRHLECSICDPLRFESYRREGDAAGRMSHYITPSATTCHRG